MHWVRRQFRQGAGSTKTAVGLSLLTLLIIVAGIRLARRPGHPTTDALPQASQQLDSRAFYVAQTGLDRSIKALVDNPSWRDGFESVPFESGTYSVKVYDAEHEAGPAVTLPRNYVRIVASSEVEGVTREVEAIWVDAMSAFRQAYSAGNHIEFVNHGVDDIIVVGNVHNNAWDGGSVEIDTGTRLYGDITALGSVDIGKGTTGTPASIYGSVWGKRIDVAATAAIHRFESLSEWTEGIDLNGDGDATDIGLNRDPIQIVGAEAVISGGHPVTNGSTNSRLGEGSVPIAVGVGSIGPIVDPRPDFTTYYETVTGSSSYPPQQNHVTAHILGDGEGHYFASADAFIEWLHFQNEGTAYCWRCAGDQRIDPANSTVCPDCNGTGREPAIEISGIFYIDDKTLDLSELGQNLLVHGTIVVCDGNPYEWPAKHIHIPGGEADIPNFPQKGSFIIKGPNRMNFTQSYRSDEDAADYTWRTKIVLGGQNAQTIPIPEPAKGHFMRDYPAIIAADRIVIEPRGTGFAYQPGDIGDERLTILQGVVYAEDEVRLHGHGGWSGEELVFDEMQARAGDDALDEPVLNVDLNGDNDEFDRVELSGITTIPVIPVGNGRYSVDLNQDGVLGKVTVGVDYLGFFRDHGYGYPTLIYIEGLVLGTSIHSCEETLVVHDRKIATGVPFGFDVSFGATTYQGLVFWSERGDH